MAMEVMVGTAANAVKQTLTLLQNQKLSHITTLVTDIHTTLDTTILERDLLKLSQKASHIIMVDMAVDMAMVAGEARDLPSQKLSHTIMVMDIIHTLDIIGVRYAEATMNRLPMIRRRTA